MKIREGFVSNSSSTAFILDLRKKGVTEFLKKIKTSLILAVGISSLRGSAVGYADDIMAFMEDTSDEYHIKWLKKWMKKLGKKNIVYVRLGDDDGIFQKEEDYNACVKELETLALDEQEYH